MPGSGEGHARLASSSAAMHSGNTGIDFQWDTFFGWQTLPSTPYGYARRRIEVDWDCVYKNTLIPVGNGTGFICFQNDVALSGLTYPDPNEEEIEDAHLIDFDNLMAAIISAYSLYSGYSYMFTFTNFRVISELQDHNHVTIDINNDNPVPSGESGTYVREWN